MAKDKPEAPAEKPPEQAPRVVVRILCDTRIDETPYRCDDVVELDADKAAGIIKSGDADPNKDAVAYATTELVRPIIKHQ